MCLATSPLHEIEEHVLQLRGTVAWGADESAQKARGFRRGLLYDHSLAGESIGFSAMPCSLLIRG